MEEKLSKKLNKRRKGKNEKGKKRKKALEARGGV